MILDRRSFMEGVPMLTMAGMSAQGEAPKKSRYYVLEQFFMENGPQPGRFHEFCSKGLVPALERLEKMPALVMEAVMAPHMPQAALIVAGESYEQLKGVAARLHADKQFKQAHDAWESGEPPYQNSNAWFLEATHYSPEFKPLEKPLAAPRYFELRVYHSPTWRQLALLHERFAGPEIKIFHRVGVHPILYSTTMFGPDRPSLTYVIPFDSLAAREKAWAAFGADPEWAKVRKESIDKGGQISLRIQISI
jgi:hypothetical protein